MNKINLKQFYIDNWTARHTSGGSHSKEAWDERAFEWVKELEENAERRERSEKRIAATAAFLMNHGLLKETDEVIDIGCGPGRYAAEFAKTAGHVTGIDISPNMCRFGEEYARSKNLNNTSFVPCDFKELDIKKCGWEGKFDLVFSSISPPMSSYESFRKAEQMSRAFCFQSNYADFDDPLGMAALNAVFRDSEVMPKRNTENLQEMFHILCEEGCLPVIDYYEETVCERTPVDDKLVRKIFKQSLLSKEEREAAAESVKQELLKYADAEGMVKRRIRWTYSWILWDIRQKKQ